MRILIAEDEDLLRQYLAQGLRHNYGKVGAVVIREVIDGVALLAALEKEPFDAIVTDDRMPEMFGSQALRRIAADPRFANVVKILVSDTATEAEAVAVGASLLRKPYRLGDLLKILDNAKPPP